MKEETKMALATVAWIVILCSWIVICVVMAFLCIIFGERSLGLICCVLTGFGAFAITGVFHMAFGVLGYGDDIEAF